MKKFKEMTENEKNICMLSNCINKLQEGVNNEELPPILFGLRGVMNSLQLNNQPTKETAETSPNQAIKDAQEHIIKVFAGRLQSYIDNFGGNVVPIEVVGEIYRELVEEFDFDTSYFRK